MITNPLPTGNVVLINRLITRCDNLLLEKDNSESQILDIKDNLLNYINSNDKVWSKYRVSVPFDYIHQEFHQRILKIEKNANLNLYQRIFKTLNTKGFNSELLLKNNAVRFIGSPKKAAKILDSSFPNHNLSVVETDTGGIFVKLGSKFKGKKKITQKEFNTVFKDTVSSNPNLSNWIDSLVSSSHSFAAEGMTAGGIGGVPNFGGVPTSNNTPSDTTSTENIADSEDVMDVFSGELQRLIRDLDFPDGTKETISEQLIILDLRPDPDPDPDPQPPSEPPCVPLWKSPPPDPRMTRIDSYNVVQSGRTSAADGFGWSVTGLSEEQNLFGKTQYVTWPEFKILSGQKGVNRVITQPSAPEGWFTNTTKPQKCSLLTNRRLLRIPSLSYDAVVIGANFRSQDPDVIAPQDYLFFKDSAEGLYIEVRDYDNIKHRNCTFTVTQAAPPYDSIMDIGALFSCNLTFKDYKSGKGTQYSNYASENVTLQGTGTADADKVLAARGLTEESTIGESIQSLYSWLYEWFCLDIPQSEPNMIAEYLRTEAGACRHRAYIMFLVLNRLGLPCRMVGSTCHAWSEIWNPDTGSWVQMDLNGCEDPPPPDKCPSCMVKNSNYNITRDGELLMCCPEDYTMIGGECVSINDVNIKIDPIDCERCIPKRCPENHFCLNDKCVPDCEAIEGVGWNYHPDKDKCINCSEEGFNLKWNPKIMDCDCFDCPDGFEMKDGNCVDENDIISDTAPKGYYFNTDLGECYPIEDCSSKIGTVFNVTTGVCECPPTFTTIDGEERIVIQEWDANLGKCAVKLVCPQGFKESYNVILSDYECVPIIKEEDEDSDIPERVPLPVILPSEEEIEDEGSELIIDDTIIAKIDATRWVKNTGVILTETPSDTKSWVESSKQDFRLQGKDSNNKRYSEKWLWGDLYGVYDWLESQANKDLISFSEPKEGQYIILFSLNPARPDDAQAHLDLWKKSINSVKDGLGTTADGVGVEFKAMSKLVKESPPDFNLQFPESSVTLLRLT